MDSVFLFFKWLLGFTAASIAAFYGYKAVIDARPPKLFVSIYSNETDVLAVIDEAHFVFPERPSSVKNAFFPFRIEFANLRERDIKNFSVEIKFYDGGKRKLLNTILVHSNPFVSENIQRARNDMGDLIVSIPMVDIPPHTELSLGEYFYIPEVDKNIRDNEYPEYDVKISAADNRLIRFGVRNYSYNESDFLSYRNQPETLPIFTEAFYANRTNLICFLAGEYRTERSGDTFFDTNETTCTVIL